MYPNLPKENLASRLLMRAMRASDLDHVVRNENLSYQNPWSKRVFSDCLRAGYECWVLVSKDQVAAHGVLSTGAGEAHVLTLCVNPQLRRAGHGRRMLRHLLSRAQKRDAQECFLEVRPSNKEARELYLSLGFVQVGERKRYYPADPATRDREDALIMSLALSVG
jgi:ribosomal-protein-alanine N-acetyltransferase